MHSNTKHLYHKRFRGPGCSGLNCKIMSRPNIVFLFFEYKEMNPQKPDTKDIILNLVQVIQNIKF